MDDLKRAIALLEDAFSLRQFGEKPDGWLDGPTWWDWACDAEVFLREMRDREPNLFH